MKVKQRVYALDVLSSQPEFRDVYVAPTEAEIAEREATSFGCKVIAVGGALLALIVFLSCLV